MIENPKYLENGAILVMFDGIEQIVPDDMANRHRIMLAEWEKLAGNSIAPYTPPTSPTEPVREISRRQFFQQLAVVNIISNAEALSAVGQGVIPEPLQIIIDQLPDENAKFNAQMLIVGASTFQRSHPLVETVRLLLGWTVEQTDEFFINAAKL